MKNVDVPSFKINGETIQEVDNVKYLGHFISNTLRDDKDILVILTTMPTTIC